MPSIFSRIGSLVPSYPAGGIRPAPAPAPTRRERPEVNSEKVASTIAAAVGGRTWFLPYGDATSTNDSPEIRAAMRMMLRDPYVKTAWLSQVLNVLSMDFQVHHPDARSDKTAQDAVDFVKHSMENADGGMVGIGSAIVANLGSDGFALAEKVGQIETRGKYAGRWSLKALKAIDPDDVRVIGDEFNNVTGLTVTRTSETFPITDFTYTRYFPLFNEPLGMAAFRASYGSYWMRDTVRKLRAIHHEKHAGGVWLGTYTDPADKGPLESALQRVRSAMWASIPEGVRMEVVQRTTASEADWKSFDESLREEILVGIALAHLHILQGGVSDARGNTKVHKEVSDLGPWYLTYLLQQTINRQVIPDLCDYNFASLSEYPRVTLGGVTNAEILEQFQILDAAQRAGFKPSKTHYAEVLTIQEADPNDPNDQLMAPQQADPFGGMGMGGMGGGGDPFGGGNPAALPPFDPNAGGGMEGFAEGRLPFEAFAFAPAKTRTGGIKAVGSGEHAGRVYYGKRAERLLRGAQRQQADPPDDPLPTVDQGTIDRAASGDGAARRDVAEHAADMIEAGTKGLGGNRPLPPEVKQKLAAPLAKQVNYGGQLSPEIAQKTAGFVLGLMDGETPGSMARDAASLGASGASTVGSKVRQFVGWAARQGAGVGLAVVKGLARAAWWLTKKAGGFLLRTSGRAAMSVLDYPIGVAKNVAQFAPFALRHLATIVGGAALLAASVAVPAALPLGVVGKLAIGIPAVAATSWTVYRRLPAVGRRLNAGAYDTATGMHSETTAAEFLRTVEAFAEWEEFAWEDWTQIDGGRWKSPGGRVLSDPVYMRLKAGKSSPAQRRALSSATISKPAPTGVASLRPADIEADPARFQFKLGTDRVTGVGEELKSVTWNPELAGVIAVWRDPADGKDYVVNGHHRLDLAKRSGAKEIAVRYLTAATAEEARAKGALINIAEGRGTAVDAAKFLRDTGRTPDDLSKVGISLKGAVARDAADLVRLDADLFRRVALGTIPLPLAIAAAKHLPDQADQRQFVQRIEQQEDRTGRPVPLRIAEELAREMAIAPRVSTATQTLFGPADDESAWVQRAEIKSYVRNELAKEAKDFRLASSTRRAQALGAVAGNSLDVTANRRIADRSTALLDDFDAVAHLKGGVSDLLNSFAVEYANASPAARQAIRQRAVVAVRSALSGDDVRVVQRDGGGRPGLFDAPG